MCREDILACLHTCLLDRYFGLAGLGWVAPYSFLRSNQPYPSRFSHWRGMVRQFYYIA